jgi:hypothetical protein
MTPDQADQTYRRRFPRRQFSQKIGLLSAGVYKLALGIEIGEGGMRITSSEKIAAGRKVIVNFFVPNKGFVTTTAEIVHQSIEPTSGKTPGEASEGTNQPFSYGMKFSKLAFESKRMIRDYIAAKKATEALSLF